MYAICQWETCVWRGVLTAFVRCALVGARTTFVGRYLDKAGRKLHSAINPQFSQSDGCPPRTHGTHSPLAAEVGCVLDTGNRLPPLPRHSTKKRFDATRQRFNGGQFLPHRRGRYAPTKNTSFNVSRCAERSSLGRKEKGGGRRNRIAKPATKRGTRRCNIGSTRKICFRSTIKDSNAFHAQPFELRGILEFFPDIFLPSLSPLFFLCTLPPTTLLLPLLSYSSAEGTCREPAVRDVSCTCCALVSASRYVSTIYQYLRTPGNRMSAGAGCTQNKTRHGCSKLNCLRVYNLKVLRFAFWLEEECFYHLCSNFAERRKYFIIQLCE